MRRAVLALAAAAVAVAVAPPVTGATATRLTVDVSRGVGRVNARLGGLGWVAGAGSAVAPLRPPLARIDASLERITPDPGTFDLAPLVAEIAAAREVGAEPLVILSYTPAWMSASRAYGRDPTKIAPADLDAWEQLVHRIVTALVTAPQPATWFEAWNEPDVPIFWQDAPTTWVDMVERTGRAVRRVERETGVDLRFGGPATAVPDPAYLAAFLARFRDPALPLDFVSWHYYGNYPFLGPDGPEPIVPEALHPAWPVVGQRNPIADPATFGGQVALVRAWTDAALAGSGRAAPELILDEWNVSAGGFDLRNDTHEGAAFDAAVLMELQRAGLDASAFFRAADVYGGPGDLGLVTIDGVRKPAWWTFRLWRALAPAVVEVRGAGAPADGLWAQASTDGRRVTVLLASFSAAAPAARDVEVALEGVDTAGVRASVRRLDAEHADAATAEPLAIDAAGVVRLHLPAQAVALVEVQPARRRPSFTQNG